VAFAHRIATRCDDQRRGGGIRLFARIVWVRVRPADAAGVFVDGRAAQLTSAGFVEVVGDLGSTHDIRVVGPDDRTTRTSVVITPEGAFPDTTTLSAPTGAANGPTPGAAVRSKRRPKRVDSAPESASPSPRAPAPPLAAEPPDDPLGAIKLPFD